MLAVALLIITILLLCVFNEQVGLNKAVRKMDQKIAQAIADLQAEVVEVKTAEQAAVTALNGIPKLLSDAIASAQGDNAAAVTAVQDVISQLKNSSADLAAAVVANTPAAPAPAPAPATPPADGSADNGTPAPTDGSTPTA